MIRPVFLSVACALAACGDDDQATADVADTRDGADVSDASGDATEVSDSADGTETLDPAETDAAPADSDVGEVIANEWGFPIRLPARHTLPCEGEGPVDSLDAIDADWICTFAHDGVTAHLYTQSTPTACEVTLAGQPVFGVNAGWLAQDGQALAPLADVEYDWGGNHHNDSLVFNWNGRAYRYYHSSIGFGFRKCHDVDSMQVRDGAGTLIEDGCTPQRTLPIVCQPVALDGTWQSLVDTFERCAGDPNAP